MSYKQRYTLFSILKYLVIFSFGFSIAFLALMDGYDAGEGEIDTFRFAFQFFTLRYLTTGIELYYQVGTIISAVNFVLMLVFYPCTDNDSYNYNGKLKLVNLLGVISVPAVWQFFTSLWALDNIDVLRYYLNTSPDFTELLCMFLTLVPALACGIMNVMGIEI